MSTFNEPEVTRVRMWQRKSSYSFKPFRKAFYDEDVSGSVSVIWWNKSKRIGELSKGTGEDMFGVSTQKDKNTTYQHSNA